MMHRNNATAYVWSYEVKADRAAAFRGAYGPDGVWAAFFAESADYLGTDLLEDRSRPNRFVTIDYFREPDARQKLVDARAATYREIDAEWGTATISESFIGEFKNSTERRAPESAAD